jgi:hypothetical protein
LLFSNIVRRNLTFPRKILTFTGMNCVTVLIRPTKAPHVFYYVCVGTSLLPEETSLYPLPRVDMLAFGMKRKWQKRDAPKCLH